MNDSQPTVPAPAPAPEFSQEERDTLAVQVETLGLVLVFLGALGLLMAFVQAFVPVKANPLPFAAALLPLGLGLRARLKWSGRIAVMGTFVSISLMAIAALAHLAGAVEGTSSFGTWIAWLVSTSVLCWLLRLFDRVSKARVCDR